MLFLDAETTTRDYGNAATPDNRLVMIAWAEDGGEVQYHYGQELPQRFNEAWSKHGTVCAFNAKFDAKWMYRHGLDIHEKAWHDPMLAELVIYGNKRPGFSLDAVCKRYGQPGKDPVIDTLMKTGCCPSEMPKARLIGRCKRDVDTLRSILRSQLHVLTSSNKLHLYRTRCQLMPILAEMEMAGLHLNRSAVMATYWDAVRVVASATKKLEALTGGINIRSRNQLAEFLYGKEENGLGLPERTGYNNKPMRNKANKAFPDGAPKTDSATLGWLRNNLSLTKSALEFFDAYEAFNKASSLLSKNLEFFREVVTRRGGKFFGQFNQTVAATHRLTSNGVPLICEDGKKRSVQLQNMPGEFKGLFEAPSEDYYVVEVDAAQLEFRVAADVCDDDQAKLDIADPDFDAHCTSASVMNEIDYAYFLKRYRAGSDEYKTLRKEAKPDTFKPLYGGKRGTEKQERWYKKFQERYSGVTRCQENWLAEVCQTGSLKLPWGMEFFWDMRYNKRGVALDAKTGRPIEPQVCNYPVQSLATAEMVPVAIISLFKRCRESGNELENVVFASTIHDSVICYVPKNAIKLFIEAARLAFTKDVTDYLDLHYGYTFTTPLGMELVYGDRWGQGTSIAYDQTGD